MKFLGAPKSSCFSPRLGVSALHGGEVRIQGLAKGEVRIQKSGSPAEMDKSFSIDLQYFEKHPRSGWWLNQPI